MSLCVSVCLCLFYIFVVFVSSLSSLTLVFAHEAARVCLRTLYAFENSANYNTDNVYIHRSMVFFFLFCLFVIREGGNVI